MEPPIAQRIIDILNEHHCWVESFEHQPVRTSEEAAALRSGYTLAQGAKAIIIRAKIPNEGKKFVMLVMPGDRKFDSSKVKQVLGSKDIRFATEDEVAEITGGVKPGGVPPFGNLFGLQVVSDPSLYANEKIIFNAGRNVSIAMESADYKELLKPLVCGIV
jgi:prolyl-tRNA editing enzyme YbaK/EbsC (Cys-tRNA(Pro) deacylase)